MSVSTIKKNDNVIAVSGVNRGRSGKVLHVEAASGRVLVEGLNLVKKTMRKTQDNPQGGITEKEASIARSNVMLFCPECKRGVRIRRRSKDSGSVRLCGRCEHSFDG
ncbi:MAG: 50S ribosomal protein L24 [Verrucomicrobia bacterium]|nr:50S ribosomal protein L24 [Verrucomicrobiota bacterium]